MSLTGILAGGLINLFGAHSSQTNGAANSGAGSAVQPELQQLGQDLQSGNLSAARQDFANIEQSVRQRTAQIIHHHRQFSGAAGPIAQDFGALAQALGAGDLAAAQRAFMSLQQAIDQPFPSLDSSSGDVGSQPSPSGVNFLI